MMYGPASPKQRSFITVLIPEREIPEDGPFASVIDALKTGEGCTEFAGYGGKQFASDLISYLMDLPRSNKAGRRSIRVGVYNLPDVGLVRVKQAHGCKDKYTQQLDTRTRMWVDAPALMSALDPFMRLHGREATEWGRKEGLCPWCTQVLEPAPSILQAMGPRCARKFV